MVPITPYPDIVVVIDKNPMGVSWKFLYVLRRVSPSLDYLTSLVKFDNYRSWSTTCANWRVLDS
jgi:hypothetical protein